MKLEELINKYGKENLVPISFIKQQLFYAKCGCQPIFIWEKENQKGGILWQMK